jgi:hypothetical protein
MSVTNDAESVLHTIRFTYGIDIRVVYQDSDGMWSEIVNMDTGVPAGTYDIISFKPWHGIEWDILKR